MTRAELRFLQLLATSQPDGLQRSRIARSCAPIVESLLTCGAATFQPSKHGRGVVLVLASEEAFQRFIDARLPRGLNVETDTLTDRATAVALFADAKAARQSVEQGVFVRSMKPDIVIRSVEGEAELPVGKLTAEIGAAALPLSGGNAWALSGTIVVVENADTFWRYEVILPKVALAIHGGSNFSSRLLSWLASPGMRGCQIIHWGDYDPVGVSEYLRLVQACPGRVVPYAPAEVDELLPRFGKRRLIIEQPKYLHRLRRELGNPHVARMVRLFDAHRRGLEQELLLRQPMPSPREAGGIQIHASPLPANDSISATPDE